MPGDVLDLELAGLDRLDVADAAPRSMARRLWRALWPKLAAVGAVVLIWQCLVWAAWRPEYVLPSPTSVLRRLGHDAATAEFWHAAMYTLRRALVGFAVALLIGGTVGIAVARSRVLRTAVGSMITGLQTMPSIAWFPLAILLFRLSEQAIIFVVVLGAAPSVANGIVAGIDSVPPSFHRLARNLGAGAVAYYRDIVVPAAMPTVLSGIKQGWAFSWRSLMAGELLVVIPGAQSIGSRLQFAREFSDAEGLLATMVVILVIGVVVDAGFGLAERRVLARRGLTSPG